MWLFWKKDSSKKEENKVQEEITTTESTPELNAATVSENTEIDFWKDEEKKSDIKAVDSTLKTKLTEDDIESKPIMKEKKDEYNNLLTIKLADEDYKIYMILFDKIKQENSKMSTEEINRLLFVNLLTYAFAS